jgi:hypothetical protein
LGRDNDLGMVEKGKIADLVFLDANPLEDIQNTQKIVTVITAGRYFPKAELQKCSRPGLVERSRSLKSCVGSSFFGRNDE